MGAMAPSLPTSPTSPSPSTFPSPSASTRAGSCSPSAPWCTWYRRLIQDAGSSGMPPFESRWCNDCRHIRPRRRTDQYRKRQQKGGNLQARHQGTVQGDPAASSPHRSAPPGADQSTFGLFQDQEGGRPDLEAAFAGERTQRQPQQRAGSLVCRTAG